MKGFTLIELVMVILLVGLLSAIAIPEFVDLRSSARNASVQGAVGGMRSAITIARAAIALKEDTTAPAYPTISELRANAYNGSHPILLAAGNGIFDKSSGIPQNPWTLSTLPLSHFNSILDCTGMSKGSVVPNPNDDRGWCYNTTNGQIWANTDRNGASSASTENAY